MAVSMEDVANQVCFLSLLYFISHMTGPTDFLHPSSAPYFKTFQVFLIYFTKCS